MDENVVVSCPLTKEEEDLENPADSDFRCHHAATVAAAEHVVVKWRSLEAKHDRLAFSIRVNTGVGKTHLTSLKLCRQTRAHDGAASNKAGLGRTRGQGD